MNSNSTNLRKAAVLVAALDADSADAVLERLPPEQAGRIRRLLMELLDVDAGEEQAVIGEFFDRNPRGETELDPPVLRFSAPSPPVVAPRSEPAAPFRFLHEAAIEDLGELLAALPDELQTDVMQRLARLDETDPQILRELESGLERRFRGRFAHSGRRTAGVGAVRQILNEATADVRRHWLTTLSRNDPRLAAKLTRPTFTFAELDRLTDAGLRTLLASVAESTAAVALAGADLAFAERVTVALPPVQAAKLRRAVDTLGPTRLSDVDAAQDELVQTARELETQGRLEWSDAASVEYRPAIRPALAA